MLSCPIAGTVLLQKRDRRQKWLWGSGEEGNFLTWEVKRGLIPGKQRLEKGLQASTPGFFLWI